MSIPARSNGAQAPSRSACQGSVLLFALVLMATASIVAYSFVTAMRGSKVSAERAIAQDLACAAARMGARHAFESMARTFAANPLAPAWAEGPQTSSFRNLNRDTAANADVAGRIDPSSAYADNDDNVRSDAMLFFLHHAYFGHMYEGQSYASEGSDWPSSYSRTNSIPAIGNPRYVEPMFFNWDGGASPVAFTQVPGSAPDLSTPCYYDADWRPVTGRTQARFRLRYAVMAMDLGGFPTWGRQQAFDSASNPIEWDKATAALYLRSFIAMTSAVDVPDFNGSYYVRAQLQSLFLGVGTSKANAGLLNPADFMYGLDAGGGAQTIDKSGALFQVPPTQVSASAAMGFTGGPSSWRNATLASNVGPQGGWLTRWIMSPFGAPTRYASTPTRFPEAQVETPWRINPLTTTSQVFKMMMRGYLPQAVLKYPVTREQRYLWDGYSTPAWPNTPAPQWQSTAHSDTTYPTPRSGGPNAPAYDLHTTTFHPPSTLGNTPFPFAGVDYTLPVTATTYNTAYPGPPDEWEDYAAFETGSLPADPDPRFKQFTARRMLGTDINVYQVGERQAYAPSTNAFAGWNEGTAVQGTPFDAAYFDSNPANTAVNKLTTWCFYQKVPAWSPTDSYFFVSPFKAVNYCGYTRKSDNITYMSLPRDPMRGGGGYMMENLSWFNTISNIGGDKIVYTVGTGSFFHQDSYWLDLAYAMANAVVTAKALYMDAACVGPASVVSYSGSRLGKPTKPLCPADLDRLFLWTLGEYYAGDWVDWNNDNHIDPGEVMHPGQTTRSRPGFMTIYKDGWDETAATHATRTIYDWMCSANIRRVKELWVGDGGSIKPGGEDRDGDGTPDWNLDNDTGKALIYADADEDGTVSAIELQKATRKIANMERVLNDMRMSFFGANPNYARYSEDANGNGVLDPGEDQNGNGILDLPFRPFDFDGDGYAVCSCYATTNAIPGAGTGFKLPSSPAVNGVGAAPDFYFSLTGYFALDPARFIRVQTRGEVWDELRRHPINEANYEAVFAIDPKGDGAAGLKDSRTLYQRWIGNFYQGTRSASGD